MSNTQLAPSITPVLSSRRLTINLRQEDGGFVEVQSCEVSGQDFLNRTSFHAARRLEDVFVTPLADALASLVSKLPTETHMLSKPDFILELPGATLQGVRLLVSEASNSVRSMIVRFKEFLGGVNRLMKTEAFGIEEQAAGHAGNLAISALIDICIPIMNFCRSDALTRMDGGDQASRLVADKVREFEFHTELLKRYLAAQETVEPDEQEEVATLRKRPAFETIEMKSAATG